MTTPDYGYGPGASGPGPGPGPGSGSGPGQGPGPGSGDGATPHDAVGAYVLGVLDDADATAFEAHLAGCGLCAARLDELSGMEPMLALLAEGRPPVKIMTPPPSAAPSLAADPPLLDRLVDQVTVHRARRRRRGRYLLAAAAALIITGPAVAVAALSGDDRTNQAAPPRPTSPAGAAVLADMGEKVRATDAKTKVSATVGLEKKAWGTDMVLELKNVKGPLKCNLIAVSKTGEEEVVTSWAVPAWGYGIENSPDEMSRKPLYVHGGAAMPRDDIDHFEVRTFEGTPLVKVGA
ncbi:anti-sigma factor [Streptomyces sp. TRM64462]|uniref:anti-sigma factor family protein n=1 Tax=Streptomyces sp. TRM64462 TaxID=2741726 RepID=UPI0015865993|nr:zf-HC2 domain-containing protein [Streptomyces sp. TRM64462]